MISLEQASGDISLYNYTNKTNYACFKQNGIIFTVSNKPLKLVEHFTYLRSNILSTESDATIRRAKSWNATDQMETFSTL